MEVFGWNTHPFEILNVDANFSYWYPYAELETRYVLDEILPLDANIIDVGANIGLISIALAKGKPKRSILSVEPSSNHSKSLLLNAKHLGLENIARVTNPLSYRAKGTKGQIWESNGIRRVETDHPYMTLDHVYSMWNKDEVHLIKIDTDGYEFKILLGAKKLLRYSHVLWSIEQTTSTGLISKLIMRAFMGFFGFKLITRLDGENCIYAKNSEVEVYRKKILQALEKNHKIIMENSSQVDSRFELDPSDFKVDSKKPKNFKLSNFGFEYSSSRTHSNIFGLVLTVTHETSYVKLPLKLIEGSLNVIVQNLSTGSYYAREIYSHEDSEILLPVPEEREGKIAVTLRTGILKKGRVIWKP